MIEAFPDVARTVHVVYDGEAGATTRTSDEFPQSMVMINLRITYNNIPKVGSLYHQNERSLRAEHAAYKSSN
jgi:hypothetical protein